MRRLIHTVQIHQAPEQIFDYMTVPQWWPQWHPECLGIDGSYQSSLQRGEQVTEDIMVGKRRSQMVWQVSEYERPYRWVIQGEDKVQGGRATLTYELQDEEGGTRIKRDLVYQMPNWWMDLLDSLVLKRLMVVQSSKTLSRLKTILEKTT